MLSTAPQTGELADERGLTAAFTAHGGELFGYARRSLGDDGLAFCAWEAAAARGMTETAVKVAVHRGLKKLSGFLRSGGER